MWVQYLASISFTGSLSMNNSHTYSTVERKREGERWFKTPTELSIYSTVKIRKRPPKKWSFYLLMALWFCLILKHQCIIRSKVCLWIKDALFNAKRGRNVLDLNLQYVVAALLPVSPPHSVSGGNHVLPHALRRSDQRLFLVVAQLVVEALGDDPTSTLRLCSCSHRTRNQTYPPIHGARGNNVQYVV